MGRAQARPLSFFMFTGRREQHRDSQGPQRSQDARLLTDASPRQTSTDSLSAGPTQTSTDSLSAGPNAWHSAPCAPTLPGRPSPPASRLGGVCSQACAARRVRPGVMAATPLTLAAASHWPAVNLLIVCCFINIPLIVF